MLTSLHAQATERSRLATPRRSANGILRRRPVLTRAPCSLHSRLAMTPQPASGTPQRRSALMSAPHTRCSHHAREQRTVTGTPPSLNVSTSHRAQVSERSQLATVLRSVSGTRSRSSVLRNASRMGCRRCAMLPATASGISRAPHVSTSAQHTPPSLLVTPPRSASGMLPQTSVLIRVRRTSHRPPATPPTASGMPPTPCVWTSALPTLQS